MTPRNIEPQSASPRSLDHLGVQGDRGVKDPGHRAVLLGLAGKASKCCFIEVGHLCPQGKTDRLMRNPCPSASSVTAASVASSVGVKPALCRLKANAMVKHPACATAISSSGLVPFSFSKRVLNEYSVSASAPSVGHCQFSDFRNRI